MIMRQAMFTGLLVFAGCSAAQTSGFLQSNGVGQPAADKASAVVSSALRDGTLFCNIAGAIAAVPGVNVKGARADKVAEACAQAQIVGAVISATVPVPVPPPVMSTVVPVATTPAIAAAAVAASVRPAS